MVCHYLKGFESLNTIGVLIIDQYVVPFKLKSIPHWSFIISLLLSQRWTPVRDMKRLGFNHWIKIQHHFIIFYPNIKHLQTSPKQIHWSLHSLHSSILIFNGSSPMFIHFHPFSMDVHPFSIDFHEFSMDFHQFRHFLHEAPTAPPSPAVATKRTTTKSGAAAPSGAWRRCGSSSRHRGATWENMEKNTNKMLEGFRFFYFFYFFLGFGRCREKKIYMSVKI